MIRIRHFDQDIVEASEINVTPFIDVTLVLLIIFMVTAPLTTVNVPVNLPSSTERPLPSPDKPIFLTLKPDHSLSFGENDITLEGLGAAIRGQTAGDKGRRIYLRADKTVDYGTLMRVMNKLRSMGYSKIALVTVQADEQKDCLKVPSNTNASEVNLRR